MTEEDREKRPQLEGFEEWIKAAEVADGAFRGRDFEKFTDAMARAHKAFEKMKASVKNGTGTFAELDEESRSRLQKTCELLDRLAESVPEWQEELEEQIEARKKARKINSSYEGKKGAATARHIRVTARGGWQNGRRKQQQ